MGPIGFLGWVTGALERRRDGLLLRNVRQSHGQCAWLFKSMIPPLPSGTELLPSAIQREYILKYNVSLNIFWNALS